MEVQQVPAIYHEAHKTKAETKRDEGLLNGHRATGDGRIERR